MVAESSAPGDRSAGLLPLPSDEPTVPKQALVNHDGSFFDIADNEAPGQGRYRTPTDGFSGIPLPLSPQCMADYPSRFAPDDHHPWHERTSPLLQSLSGIALRASRVQRANYDVHHILYHAQNFRGPIIPADESVRLRAIILAAAGYIPADALSFTSAGDPVIVRLPDEARAWLRTSNHIRVERPTDIRRYLQELVLSQDLSYVRNSTIDEFIHTTDSDRRWILGNELLGRAIRKVIEPVHEPYALAYRTRQLPPGCAQIASRFALSSLGMRRNRSRLHQDLRSRLACG